MLNDNPLADWMMVTELLREIGVHIYENDWPRACSKIAQVMDILTCNHQLAEMIERCAADCAYDDDTLSATRRGRAATMNEPKADAPPTPLPDTERLSHPDRRSVDAWVFKPPPGEQPQVFVTGEHHHDLGG